jgi:Na+-driven multidrug efflux pump
MVSGAIVNIILDPVFIFLCDWGVFGAALATVFGQILSFVLAVHYLCKFQTIHLSWGDFRVTVGGTLRTFSMGISSCVNQVAITLVQIVLNNSLTYYGALSVYGTDIPLAACGIVMKTNAILLSIIVGISQGVQPLIGFNYGAQQYSRVREAYLLAIKWNFVVSAIITASFSMACALMEVKRPQARWLWTSTVSLLSECFSGEIYKNGFVRFRLGVCLAVNGKQGLCLMTTANQETPTVL